MKPSTRLLIALAVIEALLAWLWVWLLAGLESGALQPSGSGEVTAQTVSSTMGWAMGSIGASVIIGAVVMRQKGR